MLKATYTAREKTMLETRGRLQERDWNQSFRLTTATTVEYTQKPKLN